MTRLSGSKSQNATEVRQRDGSTRSREGLREGLVNRLTKLGLAVCGAAAAAGTLRRVPEPRPRYAPWEKLPYWEFSIKMLVLGSRFGGYTAAHTLCNLVRDRDDVGVMVISRDNFFTF